VPQNRFSEAELQQRKSHFPNEPLKRRSKAISLLVYVTDGFPRALSENSTPLFDQSMASEMVVVKNPVDAKRFAAVLFQNASHFSNALDPEFLAALIRRLKQHFDPNVGPDRRAFTTHDQCTVQCHI